MNITYDDLVEKHKLLDRKNSERVADLVEGAQKLLEEYRESLVYSGDHKAKIAFIGELVEGKAEFIKLSEAHLDSQHRLKFSILTDLMVGNAKSRIVSVPLTLFKENGRVVASIEGHQQMSFIIPTDNSAYSYHQVCLAIKKTISDKLDAAMPK